MYRQQVVDLGEGFMQWVFDRNSDDRELHDGARDWAEALAERGWVAAHYPVEYGGAGLTSMETMIFNEEMARAGAPVVGGSGVVMLGPTLIVHGSDAQRAAMLPKILAGEYVVAQGYSEPGAGSDLAALTTRAVRDGDEYVIKRAENLDVRRASRRRAVRPRADGRGRAEAPRHLVPARRRHH